MKKPILLVLILALSVFGYWNLLKVRVPALISSQLDNIKEQGYDIQYTESYIGESPLLMAWKLSDITIQAKDNKETSLSISTPDVLVKLNPLYPFSVNILSGGAFEFQQRTAEGSSHYSGTVKLLQIEADVNAAGDIEGADSALALTDIKVPGTLNSPLGRMIEKLTVEAEVKGGLIPGSLHDVVKSWAEDDGRLEIKTMALSYGPVEMLASGNIHMDKNLQPVVAMKTETTGLYQAADLAVEHGYYSSLNRTEAHNVLDTLALHGDEQRGPILELEISVHDQKVLAGEMRFMTMDKIEW